VAARSSASEAAQVPSRLNASLVVLRFAVAMRAALFVEPHHIEVGDRPDPVIAEPTDAVVRVVLACVVRVGAL
jgi:hypothetical protein